MRRKMTRQLLQLLYDRFYNDGGIWPTLGYVQRALNRHDNHVDAAWIARQIPGSLLKPLTNAGRYPPPTERLVLTAEGFVRCAGSGEDVENFIIAVGWLAKMTESADLSGDQGELGARFTARQPAEAVAVTEVSGQNAMKRLLATLESEGLVREDGGTRGNGEVILYTRWSIRSFRGVKRFSDYKSAKTRIRGELDAGASGQDLRSRKQRLHSLLSDRSLTLSIATGTMLLVLLATATFVMQLLLRPVTITPIVGELGAAWHRPLGGYAHAWIVVTNDRARWPVRTARRIR